MGYCSVKCGNINNAQNMNGLLWNDFTHSCSYSCASYDSSACEHSIQIMFHLTQFLEFSCVQP